MSDLRAIDLELVDIQDQFRNSLFEHWHLPSILYQYTNVGGLQGIIQSTKWYATHYLYMNDGEEIRYGDSLVKTALERRIESEENIWIKKTFESCLGKQYGPPSLFRTFEYDIYITSFSEAGDLLDQWRAYGDDGEGYSIGINPMNLRAKAQDAVIVTRPSELGFIKVLYDQTDQKRWIELAVDSVIPVLNQELQHTTKDLERTKLCSIVSTHLNKLLVELAFVFKHPAFENEKEWRVVKTIVATANATGLRNPEATKDVYFRISDKVLVPFLKLDFASKEHENLLPLEKIFIGPKHQNRENQVKQSVRMQLLSKRYRDNTIMPELVMSDVPYQ